MVKFQQLYQGDQWSWFFIQLLEINTKPLILRNTLNQAQEEHS